jgi:Tfp pilus assembly protein PilN
MTVVETEISVTQPEATKPGTPPSQTNWTKFLVFGASVGIAIQDDHLEVVLVRARPNGVTVMARTAIADFRLRAPADWGKEFREFLMRHGEKHLSATVLLPRRDVIVRLAAVPGVKDKDISGALAFQIDSMHPFGDEPVASAWSRADAATNVMVGVIRQSVLDEHVRRFVEAGIAVAGFTFSASAIHSALRLFGPAPKDFAAVYSTPQGFLEIYGESTAKPVFSAEFDLAPARAVALAFSELRIAGQEPRDLAATLPVPVNVAPFDVMAYATALAPLAHWNGKYANLLPAENRTVHSRVRFIPTAILATLLLATGVAWLVYIGWRDQRYLDELHAEIAKVQPLANRADALDRLTAEHRDRVVLLDRYRNRTQADIEILAELSRIIPPAVWTPNVDITAETVTISGEADQAAPLLKILDSSPYFRNSEFPTGVMRGGGQNGGEGFRIKTYRRSGK